MFMAWNINNFPSTTDLETKQVLKKVAIAHRYLAELKGVAFSIPNQGILIDTLSLQEAKDSSEIENIITTHEDLFKASQKTKDVTPALKEVYRYSSAMLAGFKLVKDNEFLSLNHIIDIHTELAGSKTGFRQQAGTELRNEQTGETVYIPPQNSTDIKTLLSVLETYINTHEIEGYDPLVKMALIHHQFESIHPFTDGNGRSGRILNILYLVLVGLVDIPILYLSRYITSTKSEYYRLLQSVRDEDNWEEWIVYILEGVAVTAKHTIGVVQNIKSQIQVTKHRLRNESKIYTQDLLNTIYKHPYTQIQDVVEAVDVSRQTAAKYLEILTELGIVEKHKIGRDVFFINQRLVKLFYEMPPLGAK